MAPQWDFCRARGGRKRSCYDATPPPPPFSHAILLFFAPTTVCPPIPIKAIVRYIPPHAAHDRLTHSTESLNNLADWLRFCAWLRMPMPWPVYDLTFCFLMIFSLKCGMWFANHPRIFISYECLTTCTKQLYQTFVVFQWACTYIKKAFRKVAWCCVARVWWQRANTRNLSQGFPLPMVEMIILNVLRGPSKLLMAFKSFSFVVTYHARPVATRC